MPLDKSITLVTILRQNKLLEEAQLAEADQLAERIPEAKALARDLMHRGWLTPYQINQIFLGKAPELTLGTYHLLERIGEGGMGQVFKARHLRMGRIDALKVIKKERLGHPDTVRRFQREIMSASQLSHTNVVRAYEADCDVDTHFFAMEYVEGQTLTQRVKEKGPLPFGEACDFMRQAAQGLQHALEKGLVHRDIKPANLLVTKSGNMLKILDMGLARTIQTEGDDIASQLTAEGQVMGTPDYIAPEQAMDAHDVDIRADIYSLGCTMYFLLTGRVPFPGGTLTAKLMKHQKEDPTPISQLRPDVPPGVEEVVKVMMAKNPEERFQTPGQLAAILSTVLHVGNDISEKLSSIRFRGQTADGAINPNSVSQTVANPADATFAATAVDFDPFADLDTAAGIETSNSRSTIVKPGAAPADNQPGFGQRLGSWAMRFAAPLEPLAEKVGLPRDKAWILVAGGFSFLLVLATVSGMLLFGGGQTETIVGDVPPVVKKGTPGPSLDNLKRGKIPPGEMNDLLPEDVVAILGESRGRHQGPLNKVAVSPDGHTIASTGNDVIYLWDTLTRKLKGVLKGGGSQSQIVFSHDGKRIFTSSGGFLRVFDLEKNLPPLSPPQIHKGAITALVLFKDGKTLLTGGNDGLLFFWDVSIPEPTIKMDPYEFPGEIGALALSPNEKTLAVGEEKQVHLFDLTTGEPTPIDVLTEPTHRVTALTFKEDSKALAAGTGYGGKTVHVWDLKGTPKERCSLTVAGQVANLFYIPKKQQLICTGLFAEISVLNVASAKAKELPKSKTPTGGATIPSAVFDAKGQTLICGMNDSSVRVFQVEGLNAKEVQPKEVQPLKGHTGPVAALAFSPDKKSLAVAGGAPIFTVRVWNLSGPEPVEQYTLLPVSPVYSLTYSPDNKVLAVGGPGVVTLYDLTRTSVSELRVLKCVGGALNALAISPDSRWLIAGGAKDLYLWDLQKPKEENPTVLTEHTQGVTHLTFSHDGKTLLSCSHDKKIVSWDMTAFPPMKSKEIIAPANVVRVQLGKEGNLVYSGGSDNKVHIWDLAKGTSKDSDVAMSHSSAFAGLALAPNGQTLISAEQNGIVKEWNLKTGRLAREWKVDFPITNIEMAPDSRHFAVGTLNSIVYIFRLAAAPK